MDNILITIAARGGSKGIKDKNIRILMNKPLICHSIEQARAWGKAKRIIVSTDSETIAEVAKNAGVEVPFMRSKELADDTTPKGLVIKDALIRCEELYREQFPIIVDLDATAPLRTTDDLDKCLEIFCDKKPKTLFSVTRAHKNPYFNMVERNDRGEIVL